MYINYTVYNIIRINNYILSDLFMGVISDTTTFHIVAIATARSQYFIT
jgi:hypothetical protein